MKSVIYLYKKQNFAIIAGSFYPMMPYTAQTVGGDFKVGKIVSHSNLGGMGRKSLLISPRPIFSHYLPEMPSAPSQD